MNHEEGYRPTLRNVIPVPVVVEGRHSIGLRDPLRLTDLMVCVQKEFLMVLPMLDGTRSLRDLQWELTRLTGQIVFMDDVAALVEMLDKAYLLEGDNFRQAYQKKLAEYRNLAFRPSAHAGVSYDSDPATLREELDRYFTSNQGPGRPDFFSDSRRPKGLIAPHIEIRAGGRCFARAYQALATGQPSDVYVILGTGHEGVQGLFTTTGLDFQTPLGTVTTDREFLAQLGGFLGRDPSTEEMLHANEHVIEFQVIFLQFLFSGRHDFTIVPVLCSLSHHLFSDKPAFQQQRSLFEEFCTALREVCNRTSKSVCFIASADLDHIGPRYGDNFIPHPETVSEALRKDEDLMACLERVDKEGFIAGVAEDDDMRRICGFSPISTMLHVMEATEGRLLDLDYAAVDDKNSFVSFSSMIFH